MKKYYITADLEKTINMLNLGIDTNKLDLQSIRKNTINTINSIFGAEVTELIKYQDIKKFFASKNNENECIIGLENWIYIPDADFNFNSTRTSPSEEALFDKKLWYQITQRDWDDLEKQIIELQEMYKKSKKTKVIVCDDGIFSGDTLKKTIEIFQKAWIQIDCIRVALNFSKKDSLDGIPIESMYAPKEYIDWIDERDLFYWMPMSGASIKNGKKIYWIPYIANQKIASQKASIPTEKSKRFCKNMIEQNQYLWEAINRLRGKETELWELNRLSNLWKKYIYSNTILNVLQQEKDTI